MKKIKLLHIITGLPIGGAEKVLLDICRHLDGEKINSFVVGLNHENSMNSEFEKSEIFVKNLHMKRDIWSMIKSLRTLNNLIKEQDIKIIHAHMFHPLVFAYLLKLKNPKIKIVFTSHSENIGSKLREKITKYLKSFRDKDIVFSKEMITDMYKDDTLVIPNGVDVKSFELDLKKNSDFTFISVGVLREGKNHIALIEYAKNLKNLGYKFQIQIVGSGDASGDEQKNIENAIKKAGVGDIFKMLGTRDDIPKLLSQAHCFVMPSLYEGLPISLLEAGASKLAVITTAVGAIPSLIDQECGYLTNLKEFETKMEYVLNHKNEAVQKGQKLFEKINKKYSIKSTAISHQEIYCGLITKKSLH